MRVRRLHAVFANPPELLPPSPFIGGKNPPFFEGEERVSVFEMLR
jgi:hypothetical protein